MAPEWPVFLQEPPGLFVCEPELALVLETGCPHARPPHAPVAEVLEVRCPDLQSIEKLDGPERRRRASAEDRDGEGSICLECGASFLGLSQGRRVARLAYEDAGRGRSLKGAEAFARRGRRVSRPCPRGKFLAS